MNRRQLRFADYNEILSDVEALQKKGYEQLGQWNLGQICKHLSFYYRGSLEGYSFKLPWLVRFLFGRPLLKQYLGRKPIQAGGRTAPISVFPADIDQTEAVEEAKSLLQRLASEKVSLRPSPMFGKLSVDDYRRLHTNHSAHHLSFLIPKE